MATEMHFSVKQLAKMAGVSARTLHYYDEIGLLRPERQPGNGYRIYGQAALLRLQQILFLRELGLSLEDIQTALDQPDFDLLQALKQHRQALQERQAHLSRLVQTVDRTILYLKGSIDMDSQELFRGFTEEEEQRYTEEARQQWGNTEAFRQSQKRWSSYSKEKRQQIMEEGNQIYRDILAAMPLGPSSPQVQAGVARWHQHLRYFYEPSIEMLLGLADLYNDSPDFAANFARIHPQLAEFMRQAVKIYCQGLK
jgi:MerR family transcriptional regulator, thiopeptide resistance regulator